MAPMTRRSKCENWLSCVVPYTTPVGLRWPYRILQAPMDALLIVYKYADWGALKSESLEFLLNLPQQQQFLLSEHASS